MKEGVILGFDFGTTTIGVAIGNLITHKAKALATVKYRKSRAAESLADLIGQWGPSLLIVGYPLDRNGKRQPMSVRAERFAESLRALYRLETVLVDERYSSAVARQESPKGSVDAKAAEIILQEWLDGQEDPNEPPFLGQV